MNEGIRYNYNTEKPLLKNDNNCQSYKTLENQYIDNKKLKNSTDENQFSNNTNDLDSLRNENYLIEQKKPINIRKPIPGAPHKQNKNRINLSKGKFPNYSCR